MKHRKSLISPAASFLSADFAAFYSEMRCSHCRESYALTQFPKHRSICFPCRARQQKAQPSRSREAFRLRSAREYAKDSVPQRVAGANHRAKRLGVPGRLLLSEVRTLLAQSPLCSYCGMDYAELGVTFHLDHVVPLTEYKRGNAAATNDISNVVVSCAFCNGAKRDYTLDQFKTWLRAVQAAPLIRERRALYVV